MSRVPKSAVPTPEPLPNGSFRYGYRYIERKDHNGRKVWDQQPLTLDDVLHPQMGDVIVGNEEHLRDVFYLFSVLQIWLATLADVVVLSDVGVTWDIPNLRGHCPDVMIIRGVRSSQPFTTFDVAQEGTRPEWIIEVTSPTTRRLDLVTKRRQYFQAGVPWYAIFDGRRIHGQRQVEIFGYGRGRRAYQQLPLDSAGRLQMGTLNLWLGQEEGRAALYDANGNRLRSFSEEVQTRKTAEARAEGAEARAEGAEARAEEAEARVQALEAELRRLRGK